MHILNSGLGRCVFDLGQQQARQTQRSSCRLLRQIAQLVGRTFDREDVVCLTVHGQTETNQIFAVAGKMRDGANAYRPQAATAELDDTPDGMGPKSRCQGRGGKRARLWCSDWRGRKAPPHAGEPGVLVTDGLANLGLWHAEEAAQSAVELPRYVRFECG